MHVLNYILFSVIFKYVIPMQGFTQSLNEKMEIAGPSKPPITSNILIDNVEEFYLDYVLDPHIKDLICSMPKIKKITLCERIFQQSHYISMGIHVNKIAFLIHSIACEEHLVEFNKKKKAFYNDKISQKMYPCYGRHDPTRTNYRVDDYYKKFYVSVGKTQDSVIMYIREYDGQSDRFYSYSYHKNINLEELSETKVNVKEIQTELQQQPDIFVTTNAIEIEKNYLQEIKEFRRTDTICNLDVSLKVSLCKKIFEYHIFKKLGVTMNITAHYIFQPSCNKKYITLRFLKNQKIGQLMYTCYARRLLKTDNVLANNFINTFSLSEGPRENSVLVYYYNKIETEKYSGSYYLFQLLENIHINFLEPVTISLETAATESLYSIGIINEIHETVEEFNYIDIIRILSIKTFITHEIRYRLQKYYDRVSQTLVMMKWQKLILSTLLSVMDNEEKQIKNKYTKKIIHAEGIFTQELVRHRIRESRDNIKLFFKNIIKGAKLDQCQYLEKKNIPRFIQQIKASLTSNYRQEITDKVHNVIAIIVSDVIEEVNST